MSVITYKDAGVDRDAGDALVDRIKKMVGQTYDNRVADGVGGFACLYDMLDGRYLAAGTDGVGTKLMIAQALGIHDTIGIDLVAMCANDVLCTGARPLFFMDYLATGKLQLGTATSILEGVVEGCKQAGAALIGGETAEMPGMYPDGEYDLAGFCVGEVRKEELVDGKSIRAGDSLVAISSSGPHSNAYSLVRKLIKKEETNLMKEALAPTRIYVKPILQILGADRALIKGMAHITGSGLLNVPRMNESWDYLIDAPPALDEVNPLFTVFKQRSGLPMEELYRTFNMGMGLVIATDRPQELMDRLEKLGQKAWKVGSVSAPADTSKPGQVALALAGKRHVL